MNYFIVANNNSWGHSSESLLIALNNARVIPRTRAIYYSEGIEECIECYSMKETLKEIDVCWKDESEGDDLEFVLIVQSDEWKLSSVCEVTGNPRWTPSEEGSDPDFNDDIHRLLMKTDGRIIER